VFGVDWLITNKKLLFNIVIMSFLSEFIHLFVKPVSEYFKRNNKNNFSLNYAMINAINFPLLRYISRLAN